MHQSNHWSNALCVAIVAGWYMIIVAECFPKYDEEPEGWSTLPVFPPYNHNLLSQYYSDHNPVVFQILDIGVDDD